MVSNIKTNKRKMSEFYYEGLSLKNEDNSFFEVAPLISTNLGYFPVTGVFRNEKEKMLEVKTKNHSLKVVEDDHTFLKYNNSDDPEWKNINSLSIGDKIITESGAQEITEIKEAGIGSIFDFRVDPTHAYFTNGILSHNSMIALSMMRDPSIDLIVYMDSEGGGVTEEFAKFLGIDTSKILYSPIDTVEDLISRMEKVIDTIEKNKSSKNVLMVIDSISMLTTEREKDPSGGADMGAKAKLTRQFFRTYARKMQRLNIACVMTAHLTENIGGYGPTKTVAGGTIMGYIPSIEVRFTKNNKDSEMEQSSVGTSLVKIRGEIMKSRFGTHGKRVNFDLDMQKGLDEYAGLSDILRDYNFIIPAAADMEKQIEEKNTPKKSSGWWMFKPWTEDEKGEPTGHPISAQLFQEIQDKGLAPSGKFREKQIKEFCSEHEWFRKKVAGLLSSIYNRNLALESEIVSNEKNSLDDKNIDEELADKSMEQLASKIETKEDEQTQKKTTRKKKSSDVEITQVK